MNCIIHDLFLSLFLSAQQFAQYNAEPSSNANLPPQSSATVRKPTTPPPERRSSDAKVAPRPKTMYVTCETEVNTTPSKPRDCETQAPLKAPVQAPGKKRLAPLPPSSKVLGENSQSDREFVKVSTNTSSSTTASQGRISQRNIIAVSVKPGSVPSNDRPHSRNSSDSSGYHEFTLSGAESPEAGHIPNYKTSIDTTSIESYENGNGDGGIQESSPLAKSSRTRPHLKASAEKDEDKRHALPSTKKKKAPPPPPLKGKSSLLLL